MLERVEIVDYKTMNGRQVPIYRVTRYTKKQVDLANKLAADKLEKEFGKPSSFNEVVKILHGHAEEIKKEGLPDAQETPVQTQEKTNEQDSSGSEDGNQKDSN